MKILIVDDMASWREYNKKAVTEILGNNIEIDTANSGMDGYNKVLENNENPYDIIITDLQMEDDYAPKYAGEWFVEQIKTLPKYYKTKIIMVSASYCVKQIAESLSVDYIPKSSLTETKTTLEEFITEKVY